MSLGLSPLVITAFTMWSFRALAANEVAPFVNLQGELFDGATGTTPLVDGSITLRVQILNPAKTCVLYDEQQSVSTLATSGIFNINMGSSVGSGQRTAGFDPGNSMANVYQNVAPVPAINAGCAGGFYTPTVGDARVVRVMVTPSSTGITDTLSPDMVVGSVPTSLVAERAENLQGYAANQFLRVNTTGGVALSQTNLAALFTGTAYTNLQSILSGNFVAGSSSGGAVIPSLSSAPSSPAAGTVWFDSVGGVLKYSDGTATPLTIGTSSGSTPTGTAGGALTGTYPNPGLATITTAGKVSGSAITSGTIGGTTAITSTGNLSMNQGSLKSLALYDDPSTATNFITLQTPATASLTANYTLTLPVDAGTNGQVLSTNGSGVLSWLSPTTGSVTSVTGTAPIVSSGGATPALSLAKATASVDGYLAATDFVTFNAKLGMSTAFTGDVSGTSSTTSVDKIKGTALSITTLTSGNYLKYDGTNWVNTTPSTADLSDAGTLIKSSQMPANCAAGQTLTFTSPTGTWACSNIVVTASNFSSQTQATFLAAPTGAAGTPTFRGIAASDLPSLATGLTGILPTANGGTGSATGSITGTGALALSAGGSNQNVSIIPSGTGSTILGGSVGIGTATPASPLDVYQSTTATSGTINAMNFYETIGGSTAAAVTLRGGYSTANNSNGAVSPSLDLRGQEGVAQNTYTGTLGTGVGTVGYVTNTSTGTITTAKGIVGQVKAGNGTITTASGGNFDIITTSGTVATGYGVYIGSIAATTKFGLYSSDATAKNYFAGNVGIGTTSPSVTLDVAGAAKAYNFGSGYGAANNLSFGSGGGGMFIPAANVVAFGTGGIERLRVDSSGNVGIGTTSPTVSLDLSARTDGLALPRGTTAQQPATKPVGTLRWNTDTPGIEFWDGTAWTGFTTGTNSSYLSASGGTLSGGLTISSGGLNNGSGGVTNAGSITGVGANLTGSSALTIAAGGTAQNLNLQSSTTGSVNIGSGNGTGFSILDPGTTSNNFVTVKGAATGSSPVIGTAGSSDANVNLVITPKGTGNTVVSAGFLGIGNTSPSASIDVTSSTSPQVRIGQNSTAANIATIGVGSTGALTITPGSTNNTGYLAGVWEARGLRTNATTTSANFATGTGTSITGSDSSNTTVASLLTPSATSMDYRMLSRGANNSVLTANGSYATFIMGQTAVTAAGAAGSHPLLSQLALRPLSVTAGTSTITNTATLYVEGAASPTVTGKNYSFWVNGGDARFDGNVGIGTATPSTTLNIAGASSTAGNTSFFRMGNSDLGDGIGFGNTSGVSGRMLPTFAGEGNNSGYPGLAILARGPDSAGASTVPYMLFRAGTNAGDLITGTPATVTNRPLFQFQNATASLLTILPGGNVGIGTVSPGVALDVVGDFNTNSWYRASNISILRNSAGTTSLRSTGSMNFMVGAGGAVTAATIDATGNHGFGVTTPTAKLHLAAGTAAASTAPLKLTAGTNLTTPEDGAIEYDGSNLFFTIGSTRNSLALGSSSGSISNVNTISGGSSGVTVNAGGTNQNVTLNSTGTGVVTTASNTTLTSGTSSTSSTTGALVVTGGAGISQNLNVGGLLKSTTGILVGSATITNGNSVSIEGYSGDGQIGMDRNNTATQAGRILTVISGSPKVAATDKNGGDLILSGGKSTGTGTSNIQFQTASAQGSTNTTDNTPTTKMTILGNGNVGIGTTTPGSPLTINQGYASGGLTITSNYTYGTNFILDATATTGGDSWQFASSNSSNGCPHCFAIYDITSARSAFEVVSPSTAGLLSQGVYAWSTSTQYASATFDTGFSRGSAGKIYVGNGGQGDVSGTLVAASLGVGVTSPTAALQLKAGTATASTAPLKFTSGVLLSTPENGALEYDGTNLFITSAGTRTALTTTGSSAQTFSGDITLGGSGTGLAVTNNETVGGTLGVTGTTTLAGATVVSNSTASTSAATGAVTVAGGLGVAGSVNANIFAAAAGTAAAPSLTFTGDLASGMWSPATSAIAWSTAGTERMRILSSGNVGIGTTTPTTGKLTVADNVAADHRLEVTNASSNGAAISTLAVRSGSYFNEWRSYSAGASQIQTNAPSLNIDNINGSGYTEFSTAGSERVRIASSGNVGIGTTSPSSLLQVAPNFASSSGTDLGLQVTPSVSQSGTAGYTGLLVNATENSVGSGVKKLIDLQVGGTSRFNVTNGGAINGATAILGGNVLTTLGSAASPSHSFSSGTGSGMWAPAFNQLAFSTGGTERMRLDSLGKVGIGTTTTAAQLDVVAPASTDFARFAGPNGASVFDQYGSLKMNSGILLSNYDNAVSAGSVTTYNGALNITSDGGGGGTNHNIIIMPNGTGKVGVGLTNPAYKLDVAGDINTSSCFRIGATTVSGTCTSDQRLKENIQDYTQGLHEILGLRLRTYQFNGLGEMPKTGETAVGVIAQEVEKTNPGLVKTKLVKMHPDDRELTEIKAVDYSRFTYMLINSVQELYAQVMGVQTNQVDQGREIASLKAESDRVKSENAELKQRVERLEKLIEAKE